MGRFNGLLYPRVQKLQSGGGFWERFKKRGLLGLAADGMRSGAETVGQYANEMVDLGRNVRDNQAVQNMAEVGSNRIMRGINPLVYYGSQMYNNYDSGEGQVLPVSSLPPATVQDIRVEPMAPMVSEKDMRNVYNRRVNEQQPAEALPRPHLGEIPDNSGYMTPEERAEPYRRKGSVAKRKAPIAKRYNKQRSN